MSYFNKLVARYYGMGDKPIATTMNDGHSHYIYSLGEKYHYTDYVDGHSHEWTVVNGLIVIGESEGHTHSVPFAVLPQKLLTSEALNLNPKKKKKKKDKFRITTEDGSGTDTSATKKKDKPY